jgi:hypothetical protein
MCYTTTGLHGGYKKYILYNCADTSIRNYVDPQGGGQSMKDGIFFYMYYILMSVTIYYFLIIKFTVLWTLHFTK